MKPASLRRLPAILVIDDEVRSQEALRRTLEEDFEVFCASSAAEGMEILQKEQSTAAIQVVLCDQRMPGTTGVQFLTEVRHLWPDMVRIILSGHTDAEDITLPSGKVFRVFADGRGFLRPEVAALREQGGEVQGE